MEDLSPPSSSPYCFEDRYDIGIHFLLIYFPFSIFSWPPMPLHVRYLLPSQSLEVDTGFDTLLDVFFSIQNIAWS